MSGRTISRKAVRGARCSYGERRTKLRDRRQPPSYTERQKALIAGDVPKEKIRTTELTVIMKKATAMGDDETFHKIWMLRESIIHPEDYQMEDRSAKESQAILDALEPAWLRDLKLKVQNQSVATPSLEREKETKKAEDPATKRRYKQAVNQYDTAGNFLRQFDTASDAAKFLLVSYASLAAALHGRVHTCGGYQWRYNSASPAGVNIDPVVNKQPGRRTSVVLQENLDGTLVAKHDSVKEAAETVEGTVEKITAAIRTGRMAYCYYWRYDK